MIIDKDDLILEVEQYLTRSTFPQLIEKSNIAFSALKKENISRLFNNATGLRQINKIINSCMKDAVLFYCEENLVNYLNDGGDLKRKVSQFRKTLESDKEI